MKKILLTITLLATSLLMFSSCSKDDEDLIIGEWVVSHSVVSNETLHTNSEDTKLGTLMTFYDNGNCVIDYNDKSDLVLDNYLVEEGVLYLSNSKPYAIEELNDTLMILNGGKELLGTTYYYELKRND